MSCHSSLVRKGSKEQVHSLLSDSKLSPSEIREADLSTHRNLVDAETAVIEMLYGERWLHSDSRIRLDLH